MFFYTLLISYTIRSHWFHRTLPPGLEMVPWLTPNNVHFGFAEHQIELFHIARPNLLSRLDKFGMLMFVANTKRSL